MYIVRKVSLEMEDELHNWIEKRAATIHHTIKSVMSLRGSNRLTGDIIRDVFDLLDKKRCYEDLMPPISGMPKRCALPLQVYETKKVFIGRIEKVDYQKVIYSEEKMKDETIRARRMPMYSASDMHFEGSVYAIRP